MKAFNPYLLMNGEFVASGMNIAKADVFVHSPGRNFVTLRIVTESNLERALAWVFLMMKS